MRRNTRRTDPLFVFTAVKKMAPSSREAINPEVPGECFFFFVATWSTGLEALDACCATDEVVQIFVCCATFVLSVGPFFFFNAELVFSQGACVGGGRVRVWARGCGRVAALVWV